MSSMGRYLPFLSIVGFFMKTQVSKFISQFKSKISTLQSSLTSPSFMFKNRLFIERNERNTRLLSKLSNTFRASKWAEFNTRNLTSRFKNSGNKSLSTFLKVITTITLLYYLVPSLSKLAFVKATTSFLWAQLDATLQITIQWFVLKIFFITKFIQSKVNSTFWKVFGFEVFAKTDESQVVSQSEEETGLVVVPQHLPAPVGVNKQLLFLQHLIQNSSYALNKLSVIKLLNHSITYDLFVQNARIFKDLYRVVDSLQLQRLSSDFLRISSALVRITPAVAPGWGPIYPMFNSAEGIKPSPVSHLAIEAKLNTFVSRFEELEADTPSLRFVRSLDRRELKNILEEGSFAYKVAMTPLGVLESANADELKALELAYGQKDLSFLRRLIQLRSRFAEHQRRLYRFSLLHRTILKNSHKITNAKGLISSGFYDSSLTSSNIWAADFFNHSFAEDDAISQTLKHLLKETGTLNQTSANRLNFMSTHSNASTPTLSLNTLNFFEKSYFWNIKRFYNFNTTHSITQQLDLTRSVLNGVKLPVSQAQQTSLDVLQSNSLKSYSLTNPGFVRRVDLVVLDKSTGKAIETVKSVYIQSDNTSLFNPTTAVIMHQVLSTDDSTDTQTRYYSPFADYSEYFDASSEEFVTLKDLNDLKAGAKVTDPTSVSRASTNEKILLKDLHTLSPDNTREN